MDTKKIFGNSISFLWGIQLHILSIRISKTLHITYQYM